MRHRVDGGRGLQGHRAGASVPRHTLRRWLLPTEISIPYAVGKWMMHAGIIVALVPAYLPSWFTVVGGVLFGVGFWLWLANRPVKS